MDFFSDNLNLFLKIHQSSWIFIVILFLTSYILYSKQKVKAGDLTQFALRLFFIVMVISGGVLVTAYNFHPFYVTKGVIALIMMGIMESSNVRRKKGTKSILLFLVGIVLLIVIILMGLRVISF
ncbi:DUF1516 family protein [Alkalihalobacillus trypoxylicola]|uniref:Uncharacterized protein n=1 Tax=Alkalihalobacillus trypoxylicola TaxID=519424 RepID=A0A162F3H0_9BACI|nr:hypothetical protein AZF04_14605 [Alkalihalobacillus trypoxylicola]